MPRQKINVDQGFAGMGNDGFDPGGLGNPMEIVHNGAEFFLDDEVQEEDEQYIARNAEGKKLKVRVTKKMPDADGKVRMAQRGLVWLTPAICEICSVRFAANYTNLSEEGKKKVQKLVAQHKAKAHPSGSEILFAEA